MSRINRLAVFVEHFPPFLGSDRSVYELAIRTARKGISVHFIATQPLRYLLGERPPDWPYVKNWEKPPVIEEPNVTYEYLLLNRYLLAMWKRLPPIALVITILFFAFYGVRAMLSFRPDVVVSAHASPIVGGVAMLSAKFTFSPLVMSCPDWMSAYAAGLINKKVASWGPALLQLVEILLYKLSNRIFTATNFLKDLLIGYGINPSKIDVIPNGVDPDFFKPDIESSDIVKKYRLANRVVVLFSGHLEDWAGVSIIYNLADKLNKEYPDAVILLVGAGEPSNGLFKKLNANNLGYIVVHAGLHPFKDMPSFTAAADIALCIFPNTPVSHAASPLKLFEYMAAGNAIVATKVAGTVEIMNPQLGVLVPPDDIEAICNAVVKLCKDESMRKQVGELARIEVVKKYSWEHLSSGFLKICETVV